MIDLPIPTATAVGISLRVMTPDDLGFTARVYASTRQEELAVTGWLQPQIDAFIAQQHAAQHHHYTAHYQGLVRYAIERDGTGIGRLYLHPGARDLRVVDIALLPEARGQGIGAALLADVKAFAMAQGVRVSIHVERHNPARRLYERSGFEVVGVANEVYDLMAWQPPNN